MNIIAELVDRDTVTEDLAESMLTKHIGLQRADKSLLAHLYSKF